MKPARRKSNKKIITRGVKKTFLRYLAPAVLLVVVGIAFTAFSFYKYLHQNIASAFSSSSYSILEDPISTVLVINADKDISKLTYVIFDKNSQKITYYNIPLDTQVEVPGQFGNEKIGSLFSLAGLDPTTDQEKKVEFVKSAVFKLFAFKVDKYVIADPVYSDKVATFIHDGNLIPFTGFHKITGVKTDLNLQEIFSLASFIKSLPETMKTDATFIVGDSEQDFDDTIQDETSDYTVAKEKLSLAVINGTDTTGFASFGARVLQNAGGRVVGINSSVNTYEKSYIVTDEKDTATVSYISRVFGIQNIISKSEAKNFTESEIDRADVTLILGFDISKSMY